MSFTTFDVGKWRLALIFTPARFGDLENYLKNDNLIEDHVEKYFHVFSMRNYGLSVDPVIPSVLVNALKGSLAGSHQHYANMMIVTAAAYLESMLFDFFKNYFNHRPKSLHGYVNKGEKAGFIKVSEVVSHSSMDELIHTLAGRAAKNANDGKVAEVFSRIHKLTKQEVTRDLRVRLEELVRKRNEIAHEAKQFSIEDINVKGSYDALGELLAELAKISRSLGLPIEDPGNLVTPIAHHFAEHQPH